ncbi:MAG: DNA primase, partial [Chloroflexota bacterium]|nr:DNA primase [Chloroflexota bacterium]
MTPLELVVSRLKGVKRSGQGFSALCPAHGDHSNSLSVREDENGVVWIKCFAGCAKEEILQALNLTWSDLYPEEHDDHGAPRAGRRIVAAYDYRDADGVLLYQVVRYEPKEFRQRRPNGKGGWIWNLDDVPRVLYRLPELRAADPTEPVFLVEGEKDADNLVALALVATTNAGGATEWQGEFAEALRDRVVVLLPDNDEAGRKHVAVVGRSLLGIARELRVLDLPDLPPKGDVSDWLAGGGTAEDLRRLAAEAPAWAPSDDAGDDEDSANSADSATGSAEPWEAPVPLADLPRPPFPTDVLPGWLRA